MSNILLIGEPMAIFIANEEGPLENVEHFTRSLAGAEINVSIGLTRLGHKAGYITRLGNDPFGKYINNFLSNVGIESSLINFDTNYSTGFMLKSKVSKGDPKIAYFRKGSAASHMSLDDIKDINYKDYDHLHITGISLALSHSLREAIYKLIDQARYNNLSITFDPNLRPTLWESSEEMIRVINDVASKCDIILPGIGEGKILTGSEDPSKIAAFYLEKGVKTVIVKLGEKGAYVSTGSEEYMVKGFKVEKVVDTVGAGDGFAVGVISGILEGLPLKEAVKRGSAIGALQVMTVGDNDGLPDRAGLEAFMSYQK